MYEVSVTRSFKAVHALRSGRISEEPHEHVWNVTAAFRSDVLNEAGMVIDFVEVDKALGKATGELEGADLNTLAAFSDGCPSAECVAQWLAERISESLTLGELLYRVSVTEAENCSAAFYPCDER